MTYLKSRLLRLWKDEGGFIGALLPAIGGIASAIGGIFGGGAKKAEDSRFQQAQLQTGQDALRTSQYGIGQNAQMQQGQLDLDRKQFSEQARGGRANDAARAAILANWSPTSINVPGIQNAKISGGLQNLPESAKAAMAELYKQSVMAQLAGDKFEGGQILQPPAVRGIPQAGGLEKVGGILGTIGSIAGGVLPALGGLGGGQQIDTSASQQPQAVLENLRRIGVSPWGDD